MSGMTSLKEIGQERDIASPALRVFGRIALFAIAEQTEGSRASLGLLRWALVVIFLWFGAGKFTGRTASRFAEFMAHSPVMSWLLALFGVEGSSQVVGSLELATGAALIAGAFSALASALGAAMSCATFLITLSFLLTTPGVGQPAAGGFLMKDIVLLAASVCLLQASFKWTRAQRTQADRAGMMEL